MQTQTASFRETFAEFIAPSLRERRNLLEREIMTDTLTQLASRAAYQRAKESATADKNIAFIVFDCNNFGRVNKEISHSFGDEILSVIALTIKRAAKAMGGRAFRYGGDEFVVLVNKTRAEFLRSEIEKRVGTFDFETFTVSISGCVGNTFEEADALLQKRKNEMKNR